MVVVVVVVVVVFVVFVFVDVAVIVVVIVIVNAHPSLDTPQKKNQKTHFEDSKIYQEEGMEI